MKVEKIDEIIYIYDKHRTSALAPIFKKFQTFKKDSATSAYKSARVVFVREKMSFLLVH